MKQSIGMLTGLGFGATAMYLLDPQRGHRRRALTRDKLVHLQKRAVHTIDVASKDALHRAEGWVARSRASLFDREEPDREILLERVRAKFGRYVSRPHLIDVSVERGGLVCLRGAASRSEAFRLMRAIGRIHGVVGVKDELRRLPREALGESAITESRLWSPSFRLVAGSLGATLGTYGIWRRDVLGYALSLLGVGLLARSSTNEGLGTLLGLPKAEPMAVKKSIQIDAPLDRVFEFWSHFENFPRLLSHVIDIKMSSDGLHSHWTVVGPAGAPIAWNAQVRKFAPGQAIEWESEPGSVIKNSGRLRFVSLGPSKTRVDLDFFYVPPAGALGVVAASLFGASPRSRINEGLLEIKNCLERRTEQRGARRGR